MIGELFGSAFVGHRGTERPRDSQRQRLYNAEKVLPDGTKFDSNPVCQAYVDLLLKERWFQSRWGQRSIKVQLKSHGSATGDYTRQQINIPVWARSQRILLHEVAHVICPPQYAWHGPEYAAIYLCLVKFEFGEAVAAKLRASYAEHGVKYRQGVHAVPQPKPEIVVTQKKVAARKKAAAERPISDMAKRQTAATLRLAVKQGLLGASGSKQRAAALAIARCLESNG